MRTYFFVAALALASLGACKGTSTDHPATADNTARNDRGRAVAPTADNAGNSGIAGAANVVNQLEIKD